jgi:hypothetical protein
MGFSSLLGCALSASAHATQKQGLTIEEVTQFQESGSNQTRLGFIPEVLAGHGI